MMRHLMCKLHLTDTVSAMAKESEMVFAEKREEFTLDSQLLAYVRRASQSPIRLSSGSDDIERDSAYIVSGLPRAGARSP
jgi:hypothetical protein